MDQDADTQSLCEAALEFAEAMIQAVLSTDFCQETVARQVAG